MYLPFYDWFGTKRMSVWFPISRIILNRIYFRVDLIRFRKDFSVCSGVLKAATHHATFRATVGGNQLDAQMGFFVLVLMQTITANSCTKICIDYCSLLKPSKQGFMFNWFHQHVDYLNVVFNPNAVLNPYIICLFLYYGIWIFD